MADIFISYSKARSDLTRTLAADLEAQGLTVWWDTEMLAGESFRQRIQQELKTCKAAIVVWTPQSVTSDYVLSEAERARVSGKLIQVRTDEVLPEDLPTPFDTSHVALIDDKAAIYGALSRLGLLPDYKPPDGKILPLYQPSKPSFFASSRGRLALMIAPLALATLMGIWLGFQSTAGPTPPFDLTQHAQQLTDRFLGQMNSGLTDSSLFAADVRLGRRGVMSQSDAAAELRKLKDTVSAVRCRSDGGPPVLVPPNTSTNGFRAKVTCVCDVTDKAGTTTTKRFPLELEGVPGNGGKYLISGLWQPELMLFWQPRGGN
jgi:TIR domain